MENIVKGYKGFDKNLACTPCDKTFQYEIGKTYTHNDDIELCGSGFHFCKKLYDVNDYYTLSNESNRFCEIEAIGEIIDDKESKKSVTNKIKIVRELSKEEINSLVNTGYNNTGNRNAGNGNTGDRNTGHNNTGNGNVGNRNAGNINAGNRNTGDRNIGHNNTGNGNTGDYNTGYYNTEDYNTGNRNAGNRNAGNGNTGDYNTGDGNAGDSNTGHNNTGNGNTGNRNAGDWNTTNRSTGVFCNKEPKMIIFNKEADMTFVEWRNTRACDILECVEKSLWVWFTNMTDSEKENYPGAETRGGYLKEIPTAEASEKWWRKLNSQDKKEIFKLPNFDLKIFNNIMELKITKKEYNEVMKNG